MIKKLVFLLAAIGLIANISGCTSKSAQDETEIVENADVDKIDAEASTLTDGTTTPPASDDASLQAALGETSAPPADTTAQLDAVTPLPTETPTLDTATTESVTAAPDIAAAPTLDETSLNDIPPPTDASVMAMETPLTETPVTEPAPVVENPPVTETAMTETPAAPTFTSEASPITESAPVAKPAGSTLKKIAMTTPYQHGAGWVNTVYVARPGEKLKGISQTIFGADKSKDLKGIAENSYLKARSVKAGDKIYYVSPHRPDDSTKMLVYYEDIGMMPETYTAKKGDRLKKVAKNLLGSDKSWVELWTSNPVESKDKLADGEVLKYWRSASSVAPATPTLAQNTPPPADPGAANLVDHTQMPAPPPPDMNTPPSPPPQELAQNTPPPPDMNTLPPPPPPDAPAPPPPDMNAAPPPPPPDMNAAPPPPPDMNAAPPPPPPPSHDVAAAGPGDHGKKFNPGAGEEEASAIGGLDQDTLMSLGALAVLVIALAFVLISRNKKKRAAELAMTEHDVGT